MTAGRLLHTLGPSAANPRNSEGAFVRLDKQELLFVYSRYCGDSWQDHASADLYALRSKDLGESWGEPFLLLSRQEEGAQNLMSVSLLPESNGFSVYYLRRRGLQDLTLQRRLCLDGGRSLSAPTAVMQPPGYYVVNNDRVVRLSSGRLVVPAARHTCRGEACASGSAEALDMRACLRFFLSDDGGASFYESPGGVSLGVSASMSGLQEPGLVELKGGVLWCFARTDLGRQYECYSLDGGYSWTSAQPSRFTAPLSPLSARRLADGRLMAVWNPIPLYNGRSQQAGGVWTGGRTPLVYALSCDEGGSWSEPVALEDAPDHGYCYTAMLPLEDRVLLAYCSGGPQDGGCLNRISIRALFMQDL